MNKEKAEALAENLKGLACIECTKNWLAKYEGLTDPIQDIRDCAALGFITLELQERLVDEIKTIKLSSNQ